MAKWRICMENVYREMKMLYGQVNEFTWKSEEYIWQSVEILWNMLKQWKCYMEKLMNLDGKGKNMAK